MASIARTFAGLSSRLSVDSGRCDSPVSRQLGESRSLAASDERGKCNLPSSTSFSDFSLCAGEEVSGYYDASGDYLEPSMPKRSHAFARNSRDEPRDEAHDEYHSAPIAYMRTAFTQSAPGQQMLSHTMSMPLSMEQGSDNASSSPMSIPKPCESRSHSLRSEDGGSFGIAAMRPRRSLIEIMTTPSPIKDSKSTLDYYEFADVMRSY